MRYHLISNDDDRRRRWRARLRERGFDVVDEYDPDAIVVTLGGDGTILYAARACPDPTILPVRTGGSRGYRTQLDSDRLVETLEALDAGREGETYTITEHRKIGAYRDGAPVRGGFDALNEISVHHSSPVLAAVLRVRVRDGGDRREFERVVGDGVLVATPFGSTAYYRAITGGTFSDGLGIAFNNVHAPVETPTYLLVSAEGAVEVELLASDHASGAVLTRDNDGSACELTPGEPVEIRRAEASVEVVTPLPAEG